SLAYARARAPNDSLVGQRTEDETLAVTVLEPVPHGFTAPARELLKLKPKDLSCPSEVRFADNVPRPSRIRLRSENSRAEDSREAVAIPSGWSMVLNAAYAGHVIRKAAESGEGFSPTDVHEALVRVLLALLEQGIGQAPLSIASGEA